MLQDLRYGVRMLWKTPSFTFIAVAMLALGIAANTAIFSVVNAVLLRPLPYASPDGLVLVQEDLPKIDIQTDAVSSAEFVEYVQHQRVFSDIAGFTRESVNMTGQGEAERIRIARVSSSLFPELGIGPLAGRTFTSQEEQPGRDKVAILSERLWRRAFGGDAAAIGKTLRLDEKPYTIVGIIPARFQFPFPTSSMADAVEAWVPLALDDNQRKTYADSFDYGVIGRLKPGETIQSAQSDMETIAAAFQEQHPEVYNGNVEVTVNVIALKQKVVGRIRPFLLTMVAAVGLVLLIACANVASLLLARGAARHKEMAIRYALGGSFKRVFRQLLTESILLAALGGVSGLLLAAWAVDLIRRFGPNEVPRLAEIDLDMRVLVFTMAASILTGVLFGLAPALQSLRVDVNTTLKEGGKGVQSGSYGERLRSVLVVLETAAAVILLTGAGLLINSFVKLLQVSPGFNPDGAVIARTAMTSDRYPKIEEGKGVYKRVLDRLASLPGVQAAGLASGLPLHEGWTIGFRVEGYPPNEFYTAANTWVSNDYFKAMGIPMLAGRTFNDDDLPDRTPAIVVNHALAARYWPGESAIGKRLHWGGWDKDWLTIVGVVTDVKVSSLEAEPTPAIYMPVFQISRLLETNAAFVVRSSADPATVAAAIRDEIRAVDDQLPVYNVMTMNQMVAQSVAQRRFLMVLLTIFAGTAMLLAAGGLYGLMSYSVSRRSQEIGIRMALGARQREVVTLVVRRGLALTVLGVAVGLGSAYAVTGIMKTLLFGISATDPLTFSGVALTLFVVAAVACYRPARRATRVDPMVALRYE